MLAKEVATAQEAKPAAPSRIKVDRAWIGPPVGTLGNPTVWLFVFAMTALVLGVAGYVFGTLPVAATIAINAVSIYLLFTVMHDSMHRTAHRSRWVNDLLGRLSALPLTVTMPLFRAVHYEHHSHTNDPDRDPDLVVSRRPRWALLFWCLSVIVEYRRHYFGRRMWRDRSDLLEAVAMECLLLGAVVVSAVNGTLGTVLIVWLVPAVLAVVALALAFDFLPHYPYESRERYHDTRIYPGRVLNVLLLGQNYHLIHHLWTTIPWFRYQRVFASVEPQLVERGARIEATGSAGRYSGAKASSYRHEDGTPY
ncbi:MAG: fatty acid desaturase [Myxococcota bacterium]